MSIKGNEKSFESSLASERLLGIVYILFLIIVIATTIDAGTRGVASVMDNGELDYFNPTELKAVLVSNIIKCSLGIIGNIVRTAIVVWAELKFSLAKTISLYVIIALQISVTLYIVYRFAVELGLATAML